MAMDIAILSFFLLTAAFAWLRFRMAISFLILILPAYLIRFNIGPLPSTLFEITFGAIFIVWLIKYARHDLETIKSFIKNHKFFSCFIVLFFLASLLSTLINPTILKALGIWRAYFLEPTLLFVMLIGRGKELSAKYLIDSLALSSVSVACLAIMQKIFGGPFPPSLWDDELFGRPTSFFTTPNAIGLLLVPITILLLPSVVKIFRKQNDKHDWWRLAIFILNLFAIILSFSQGAWIALGGGILIFALLTGYKRFAATIIAAGIILSVMSPALRSAVLFQDQAGKNRLTLWGYSIEYLTENPKQFILGSGLRRFFTEVQKPYYDVKQMERLIYPHNLFLNFWLETGLIGALSFTGILVCLILFSIKILKSDKFSGAVFIGTLTAIIVHGLVDVPYFKNDLSMLFWLIASIIILSVANKIKQSNGSAQ